MVLPASDPLPTAIRQNHQAFDLQGIMCRVDPGSLPCDSASGHFGNIIGHFPAGGLSNIEAASGTGLALHHDDGWPGGHTPEAQRALTGAQREPTPPKISAQEQNWGGEPQPTKRPSLWSTARFAGKTGPVHPGRFFFDTPTSQASRAPAQSPQDSPRRTSARA